MKKMMQPGIYKEMEARNENIYDGNSKEGDSYAADLEKSRMKMANGGSVKKGPVLAIVARMNKGKGMMEEAGEEMEEGGEGGDMMKEAKMAAASEVMDALKSGNKESFAMGLENFMKACGGYED